jgi:hypothetical protein
MEANRLVLAGSFCWNKECSDYDEIEKSKSEVAKYEMALKSKDDEIGFLRGHVAQLPKA